MANPSTTTNVITDPTGGAPNFNIKDVFSSYGYDASQAEIDALAPAFEGRINVEQTGRDAVASYVQAHQELKGAQSAIQGNLLTEQQAQSAYQSLSNTLSTSGQAAYEQAANLFTQAPKLFGSMTPDQIDQYLAPTKTAFGYGLGQVEGSAAQRGLAGSSLEAQAMAQAQTQFQQNVLNQGLSVGMTQQQQQAQGLQALGSGRMGLAGNYANTGLGYQNLANSSAGQNANMAQGLAGLPGQAVNQAIAQQAAIQALNPKSTSFFGGLAQGFENMGQQAILNLGQNTMASVLPMTQPGVNSVDMLRSLMGSGRTPTGAPSSGGLGGGNSYMGWTPAGNPNLNLTGGLQTPPAAATAMA